MRHATLAAAALAAGSALATGAQANGACDPRYLVECVPIGQAQPYRPAAGAKLPGGHGQAYAYVAIPQESHRPVVTGDPFIGGSGYVKDHPAYPLAVQAPHALRPVPYVWGYVTQPGVLPQDPPPAYVRVRVRGHAPVRHYAPAYAPAGLK